METTKKIISLLFRKIRKEKNITFFIIFLVSTLVILSYLSDKYLIEIPKEGGEINEIVINEKPRFINPVLSITNIDKSLISLIYTPLFTKDKQGNLIENIATYKLDSSGKKYTLKLRDNIYFHDGEKMDIDDVIFTIQQIQNPQNNSFYRPEWSSVELKKINSTTVELILPGVNHYFKDSLVLYILPKHIWENVDYFNLDNKNISPIGSGPFKIDEIKWFDDNTDKKIQSLSLVKNTNYFKGKIFLNKIIFNFFDSKEEFLNSYIYKNEKNNNIFSYDRIKEIDGIYKNNLIDELIDINLTIKNKNTNKFLNNKAIRKFIFKIWNSKNEKEISNELNSLLKNKDFNYDKENNILKYKKELISFSVITGSNQDESLIRLSEKFKEKLRKAGIDVNLKKLDAKNYLNKYRNRDFESIISGYHTEEKFWFYYFHSSQKNDPWINIAQFNSLKINNLLIDLRKNLKIEDRNKKIKELKNELDEYSLLLNLEKEKSYYYTSKNIGNLNLEKINSGENRFYNIQNWVVETEKILPFFKN